MRRCGCSCHSCCVPFDESCEDCEDEHQVTPIKCFRVLTSLDGSATIWTEDWAGNRMLYAIAMNKDATYWVRKSLSEAHKVPALDWDEEYKA